MNDAFETRLRAAVQAGWRALLIGLAFVTLVWLVYLSMMRAQPAWLMALWGTDLDWSSIGTISLWSIAVIKLGLYAQAMLVLFGALWLSQLRKAGAPARNVRAEASRPLIGTPSPAAR